MATETSGRIDSAELLEKQLQQRHQYLKSRVERCLRRLESQQLELGAGADHDMPLRKGDEENIRNDVQNILAELGAFWNSKKGIAETAKELDAIETRIQSLEALFPGEAEKN